MIVDFLNNIFWSYLLIILLIGAGIYFTLKNNFVQFRMMKEMVILLKEGTGETKHGISSFQAFCISTASRVGTGNLAGVALAVAVGGPGAVFWMWLMALLGSASAFVESTIAQVYKEKNGTTFKGGPAYYIEKALHCKWLGLVFAILISITYGLVFNSVQANTISLAFENAFGIDRSVISIVLFILTGLVIFGGIHRIASISEKIVPFMAVIYVVIVIGVLVLNIKELPGIIVLIVKSAFGPEQFTGGALGAAVMQGIKRGLFSNEAGMGSAPNAAATAHVTHPVKQGLVQTLAVFTDTLIVCSATAFLILVSGTYKTSTANGIALTQEALTSQIGSIGGPFVAICIFLFAFSSLVGNYYYGEANIQFLCPKNKTYLNIYRLACLFMIGYGSIVEFYFVWSLADLFMALMAVINIYAILRLGKIAKLCLDDYISQKKAGKDPVFKAKDVGITENVECWK
ncbi:alanine/glycine:cation symporter family protein [Fusobacterium sp.]|uniref:alanine/glycine:cation symporter family protein n=1 Tax=Fusobacterium sp. TaxID=68766 RepID=UPI002630068B|nr:alanine/glycine:cation symporter family protein [Fusobacterium sp.]